MRRALPLANPGMPLDSPQSGARPDPAQLDDFRITSSQEVEAWLRQLLVRRARVQLGTPGGAQLSTRLSGLDVERNSLNFELGEQDPQLRAVLDSAEVVAVAYLDSIRLEFELVGLVSVHGADSQTLRGALPTLLYRFQRRQAYRVHPLGSGHPRVLMQHPQRPELGPLQLRVLDLSVTGLALLLPAQVPEITPGQELPGCRIELDRDSHFETRLQLQHVSVAGGGQDEPAGQRLGCAFGPLPSGAERALQLYIDQTQKRQRLLKKP